VPGFPIRTSSDHSSVDSSPRPIAASHVLHRLLMPRHPPCALKHLFTTRCSHPLCNTQHTTTPQPTQTTTTPTSRALDDPGQRPKTQPNGCPFRTQQRAEPPNRNPENHESDSMFHPATPTPSRRNSTSMESRKRRTSPEPQSRPTPPHGETP
jgi:hypothetical protein